MMETAKHADFPIVISFLIGGVKPQPWRLFPTLDDDDKMENGK
jgi:hypothetical protein